MLKFLSYNYTWIVLCVLKDCCILQIYRELFSHSTCVFCSLDSNSMFMGCVVIDIMQEHRAVPVFPLADNAVVHREKHGS